MLRRPSVIPEPGRRPAVVSVNSLVDPAEMSNGRAAETADTP